MNPHPSIYPFIIKLWNEKPARYFDWAFKWMDGKDARKLIELTNQWIIDTNYPVYLDGG